LKRSRTRPARELSSGRRPARPALPLPSGGGTTAHRSSRGGGSRGKEPVSWPRSDVRRLLRGWSRPEPKAGGEPTLRWPKGWDATAASEFCLGPSLWEPPSGRQPIGGRQRPTRCAPWQSGGAPDGVSAQMCFWNKLCVLSTHWVCGWAHAFPVDFVAKLLQRSRLGRCPLDYTKRHGDEFARFKGKRTRVSEAVNSSFARHA